MVIGALQGTLARNFACATLLAAWHSVLSGGSDGPRKVATLDSLFRTGIPMWSFGLAHGNLALTYLREEGRLVALTGDRAGAIRAYQPYLVLWDAPELSVRPQVAEVRKELAKLLAER